MINTCENKTFAHNGWRGPLFYKKVILPNGYATITTENLAEVAIITLLRNGAGGYPKLNLEPTEITDNLINLTYSGTKKAVNIAIANIIASKSLTSHHQLS